MGGVFSSLLHNAWPAPYPLMFCTAHKVAALFLPNSNIQSISRRKIKKVEQNCHIFENIVNLV
jgi:hypothetical protein